MNRTVIVEEFSPCNDPTIVKGKRSKRPRPSSSSASSRSSEFICNSSPASSTGISTSTSEDEDMANCLILLARGGFQAIEKSSSPKFTEVSAAAGKVVVGAYDYECKTCSRTFPSFQALGGHRASHKKPKQGIDSIADDRKKSPPAAAPKVPAQLMLPSKISLLKVDIKTSKIHECSVCGSEFGSGQALGGHMRRHRSGTSGSATVRPSAARNDDEKAKNVLALNLDLNLPAPQEDDFLGHYSSNQQPRIVFSAAALVDCHY